MPKIAPFKNPRILKRAGRVLSQGNICNNCLGRQFAQVSTGLTNKRRGEILRKLLKAGSEPEKCKVCSNIFKKLERFADETAQKFKGTEFRTFSVGNILSPDLIKREESLWEDVGIEHCEPIKSEINRELGKLIEKGTGKTAEKSKPDILVILNLRKQTITIVINPIFVYGRYKKLIRGIPQTKWDKYPETVEDIIAKPFIKATRGSGHSMHAAGREDIDAKCLDWRPFVLEISEPRKRMLNLKNIQSAINKTKKVSVRDLKASDKKEVIKIKEMKADKTYRVLISLEKPVKKRDAEKLKTLCGTINQRTPARVMHRRADILRRRRVKGLKYRIVGRKRMALEIRGEAGLYIKEIVTGDNGRTKPSVSSILNNPAKVLELDVIKIWV